MLNDVELLQMIAKNSQMGCKGIEDILPYTKTEEFRKALEAQKEEYGKIYKDAERLILERNEKLEDISPVAKMSTKTMTMMKTMQDDSEAHLAEMMYQGSAMGVTKILRNQKEYAGSNPKIKDLAQRLLTTEENNMEQMRKFL